MLNETTLNAHQSIVVAVSGGSDSTALLNLLATQYAQLRLFVATVNHQLRPEAADEANHVVKFSASLNLPHKILHWDNQGQSSSKAAREGRYELLVAHAKSVGAGAIALGHTMDDQAETILMRAQRLTPTSGTRGLSGMSPFSTYEGIALLRPLLNSRREALRDYLRSNNTPWIEDPSNEKMTSERVRIRKSLFHNPSLPRPETIAKLASLSARHRHWLNKQTAGLLEKHTTYLDNTLILNAPNTTCTTLLAELFSTLILVSGGQPYRPSRDKLESLTTAYQTGQTTRKAVGRSLIMIKKSTASFIREARNLLPPPAPKSSPAPHDNRLLILPDGTKQPYITALERFRPSTDDCLHKAVMNVLSREFCST